MTETNRSWRYWVRLVLLLANLSFSRGGFALGSGPISPSETTEQPLPYPSPYETKPITPPPNGAGVRMTLKGYVILVLVEAAIFAAGTGLVALQPQWEAQIWLSVAGAAVVAIPVVLFGPALLQLLRANGETLATLVVTGAILGVLGWGLYSGVRWLVNRPPSQEFEWTHHTMSLDEQTLNQAECRMEAVDTTSVADPYSQRGLYREYMEACLTSRGFIYEQIPDSN